MRRSTLVAIGIAAATAVWMASGMLGGEAESPQSTAKAPVAEPLRRVQVTTFQAQPLQRSLILHGETEPHRTVTLRAESPGAVAATPVARGSRVRRGEELLRLANDDRRERLAQARALLRQRELEFEGAQSLKRQNLSAERQLAEAQALLESARAELKAAELNLARAQVRAPFDAVLEQRPVEVGDYVGVGDPVAVLVELDPLLARADVAEQRVERLRTGMPGSARLVDGREVPGTVTFVAAAADTSTRTFAVEMTLANPDLEIPAGMTAELHIPTENVSAQRVSAAVLTLNDAGEIGVMRVDEEGIVRFQRADVIKADNEAVWLGGLSETVRLIVVGQGFVADGERVEAVERRP